MSNATWQDVALALIAAIPGAIAAVSSLQNGRKIDKNHSAGVDTQAHLAKSVNDLRRDVGESRRSRN